MNFLKIFFPKKPTVKSVLKSLEKSSHAKVPKEQVKVSEVIAPSRFEQAAELLDRDESGYFIDSVEDFEFDIVGEASYQNALKDIAGPKSNDGMLHRCTAILSCENSNKFDKNAVCVKISDQVVGYLAKSNAKDWRIMLRLQNAKEMDVRVEALIVGGWSRTEKGEMSEGSYGVKLDIPIDED